MFLRLKGKIYWTIIGLALLYGLECWAFKNDHSGMMGAAEMQMFGWISGQCTYLEGVASTFIAFELIFLKIIQF